MKLFKAKYGLIIAALAASLAGPAFAADVYHADGGLKDDAPIGDNSGYRNHSGFYIRGDLGIANINRDVSRTVNRGIDLQVDDPAFTALLDGADGSVPDGVISDTERDAGAAFLDSFKIPHTIGEDSATIPLIGDQLRFSDSQDIDSFVFGGEISHLWQRGNLGFEVGLGITGYGDAESTHGYAGKNGKFVGGTAFADADFGGGPVCTGIGTGTCAGDKSPFTQSGVIKFDRDFDIDLIGRFYYFAMPNLAFNVGAGASWARASVKAVNADDGGASSPFGTLNTSIDENVSSLGYVLTAGATYWLNDRVTIGLAYDYKAHSFDASGSAADSVELGSGVSLQGHAHDRVNIDDDTHTIKGRIGIKLN